LCQFFDDCLQEKNKIVKDALYAKAKVIAAVEMANLNPNTEFSSDDMFTRMLQKTESTLEEVSTCLFLLLNSMDKIHHTLLLDAEVTEL